jgi:hypothetical protein
VEPATCSAGVASSLSSPSPDQSGHRKRHGSNAVDRPPRMPRPTAAHVVEGSFNVSKNWRGLATRYDKLAITYRGGVVLASITI